MSKARRRLRVSESRTFERDRSGAGASLTEEAVAKDNRARRTEACLRGGAPRGSPAPLLEARNVEETCD